MQFEKSSNLTLAEELEFFLKENNLQEIDIGDYVKMNELTDKERIVLKSQISKSHSLVFRYEKNDGAFRTRARLS